MRPIFALLLLAAPLAAQTTGRTYYPVPLDSVSFGSHSYIRVAGKVYRVENLSTTVRVTIRAGDDTLALDCVKSLRLCPPIDTGEVVMVFGKRYHSTATGWRIRPVEGVQKAGPVMFYGCRDHGIRRTCVLSTFTSVQ